MLWLYIIENRFLSAKVPVLLPTIPVYLLVVFSPTSFIHQQFLPAISSTVRYRYLLPFLSGDSPFLLPVLSPTGTISTRHQFRSACVLSAASSIPYQFYSPQILSAASSIPYQFCPLTALSYDQFCPTTASIRYRFCLLPVLTLARSISHRTSSVCD